MKKICLTILFLFLCSNAFGQMKRDIQIRKGSNNFRKYELRDRKVGNFRTEYISDKMIYRGNNNPRKPIKIETKGVVLLLQEQNTNVFQKNPIKTKNKRRYINAWKNVDYILQTFPEGIKTEYIIKNKFARHKFLVKLSLIDNDSEIVMLEDSTIVVVKDNEAIIKIQRPYAWCKDNNYFLGERRIPLSWNLIEINRKQYMVFEIEGNRNDYNYPITIDPTISVVLTTTDLLDTYLFYNRGNVNTEFNYGVSTTLFIGASTTRKYSALLWVNLADYPSNEYSVATDGTLRTVISNDSWINDTGFVYVIDPAATGFVEGTKNGETETGSPSASHKIYNTVNWISNDSGFVGILGLDWQTNKTPLDTILTSDWSAVGDTVYTIIPKDTVSRYIGDTLWIAIINEDTTDSNIRGFGVYSGEYVTETGDRPYFGVTLNDERKLFSESFRPVKNDSSIEITFSTVWDSVKGYYFSNENDVIIGDTVFSGGTGVERTITDTVTNWNWKPDSLTTFSIVVIDSANDTTRSNPSNVRTLAEVPDTLVYTTLNNGMVIITEIDTGNNPYTVTYAIKNSNKIMYYGDRGFLSNYFPHKANQSDWAGDTLQVIANARNFLELFAYNTDSLVSGGSRLVRVDFGDVTLSGGVALATLQDSLTNMIAHLADSVKVPDNELWLVTMDTTNNVHKLMKLADVLYSRE